jgi:hypothetical protein
VQLVGKDAFSGQTVARLENTFEDKLFNLVNHGICGFMGVDRLKHAASKS